MRQHTDWYLRFMLQTCLLAVLVVIGGGCVSTDTHSKALGELEAAKKLSSQQAAEL